MEVVKLCADLGMGQWGSHIAFTKKGNQGSLQHDIPKTLFYSQWLGDCRAKYMNDYSIQSTWEKPAMQK